MVLAVSLVARTALDYFISWCYAFIHGSLLLAWAVTLNVSINSAAGNTIMVLLVSNNFIELKAVALKPFRLQNLFQIAMRDAVERIQMSLFVIAIVAYTRGDFRVGMTWYGTAENCQSACPSEDNTEKARIPPFQVHHIPF